ncbi:hypothetical protein Acr_29g0003800 [Actinidia rufa]|uniref:OTU domain-containing protein n=1 Tax=Actinidia rufa TaxID=165716 RepID=A0A7J0HDT2_9ERIC|nr:hypothetical protein Acr_29g0003800 [Actinidia rufa]
MDDYLGSFSDSWSFENDVPSGESISNNSRDYTTEFSTDQIFESREVMINWAKTVGLENGIVVVIKNSANLKGGKLPKCHLMCERGGEYKPHRHLIEGQSLKKKTRTKKCECPFELRGIPIPPDGVMWGLRVVCDIPSFEDASTSGSMITQPTTTSRGRGRCGRRSVVRNPPIHDTYIEKLPVDLQRYISHTVDVQPDGHCRFRAIAALIGYSEEGWSQVRLELIEEIQQNKDLYDQLYPDRNLVATLLFSLNWFEPWAPEMYWMDSMPLGIVIASRYNLVLHTFGENIASCFTHLPLRSPPVPNQERREIAIAHVGNHFVQVFLHPHYPVPPIPTCGGGNIHRMKLKDGPLVIETRVHLWYEVIGAPSGPGAEFGGNID